MVVMELLLIEAFEARYVSSSGVDHPFSPRQHIDQAQQLLAAAQKAKQLVQGFDLPARAPQESLRRYQARVADALEIHLAPKMDDANEAALAADRYLARCITDPPLGYEE
jgi:hypothetical protein